MPRPCHHPDEILPSPGQRWRRGECRPCWLYANRADYRALWGGQAVENGRSPVGNVGTQLRALFGSIGLSPAGCRCNERVRLMDGWGTEGCREKKDEIVSWLRDEYKRVGWAAILTAVGKAVSTGLVFRLSVLDPVPDLVDEAIRRAEEVEKSRGV